MSLPLARAHAMSAHVYERTTPVIRPPQSSRIALDPNLACEALTESGRTTPDKALTAVSGAAAAQADWRWLVPGCDSSVLRVWEIEKKRQRNQLPDRRFGAPGRIRTHDPQIRSLVLYPAELPVLASLRSSLQARGRPELRPCPPQLLMAGASEIKCRCAHSLGSEHACFRNDHQQPILVLPK